MRVWTTESVSFGQSVPFGLPGFHFPPMYEAAPFRGANRLAYAGAPSGLQAAGQLPSCQYRVRAPNPPAISMPCVVMGVGGKCKHAVSSWAEGVGWSETPISTPSANARGANSKSEV